MTQPGVNVLTRIAGRDRPAPEDPGELVSEFTLATRAMSAAEAAELAGVSEATLSRWRRGGVRRLRNATRLRLARVLEALDPVSPPGAA